MAMLALVAVASLLACGQIVLTEPAPTTSSDPQQTPGQVPTATRAERPTPTLLPTIELPTATPFPPGFTAFNVILPSAQSAAVTAAGCSRPAGTSLPDLLADLQDLESVIDEVFPADVQDGADWEDRIISALEMPAEECPQVFQAIINKEWKQIEIENTTWAKLMSVVMILQISWVGEDDALAALELPFLGILEHLDGRTMSFWRDLLKAAPGAARSLISSPAVLDMDSDALPTDFHLLYLRSQGPAVSEGLESLQWLVDGLDPPWDEFDLSQVPGDYHESETIESLTTLHLKLPRAFLALVRRPWLQESMDSMNYTALVNVIDFAYASLEATAQIAEMDFMDTLEERDIIIIQELLELKWDDRSTYRRILSDRYWWKSLSPVASNPWHG